MNKLAPVDMRKASQMTFFDSIVKKFTRGSADTTFNKWKHICTFNNIEDLSVTGTTMTSIFPNWNNTNLVYESPREAVENGQSASQARFWINPNSARAQSNSPIGPSWLRTG